MTATCCIHYYFKKRAHWIRSTPNGLQEWLLVSWPSTCFDSSWSSL